MKLCFLFNTTLDFYIFFSENHRNEYKPWLHFTIKTKTNPTVNMRTEKIFPITMKINLTSSRVSSDNMTVVNSFSSSISVPHTKKENSLSKMSLSLGYQ